MSDLIHIRRALLSVSDKTGLVELGRALAGLGVELISTGGSAEALRANGIVAKEVSELTGLTEMMDGRIKTLHHRVHAGLLSLRDRQDHVEAMNKHGIQPIDLLVVNLYPFEKTVASQAHYSSCIENIDIGGPAMIRAAAKNHVFLTVLVDIEDYAALLTELSHNHGATRLSFRRRLAEVAFARTSAYDAAIATWMTKINENKKMPRRRIVAGELSSNLRYGENPHQNASLYLEGFSKNGIANAHLHQGKELSYNNILDADSAFKCINEFMPQDGAVCVIVKHSNPCGVAKADSLRTAYERAFLCDQTSAFGGVLAFNHSIDYVTAQAITGRFAELVIAPGIDEDAFEIFKKRKNLRLLTINEMPDENVSSLELRQISGGFLVQDTDTRRLDEGHLKFVTKRKPNKAEMADLLFAWKVVTHVKSNAIVYAKDSATVGVGAGQMSRVDSAIIAKRKAEVMFETLGLQESPTKNSAVASDAFFPFPDGLLTVAEAGASAVIQPGGALRDDEVIAAADSAGIAMVFTGIRHFRH
ncbi:MAG: bifunctional phosphoribosylaminoimidazolecarboxamide formyltransferase/IMP cyclohydrolase [Aestuariivita sp.]|nr:bifunctional phosphoribosylaminoimidazolecarboxamide formyltransferase/IMP cyclohydrolase [Aestuariivita sp.]